MALQLVVLRHVLGGGFGGAFDAYPQYIKLMLTPRERKYSILQEIVYLCRLALSDSFI